jgi:hypothetical protein
MSIASLLPGLFTKPTVEEAHSLRKATPHAGKVLLRLNVAGTRVGLQPHALSQACAALFMGWNGVLRGFSARMRLLDWLIR